MFKNSIYVVIFCYACLGREEGRKKKSGCTEALSHQADPPPTPTHCPAW